MFPNYLGGGGRPTRKFFTHIETSPLLVKDLCSVLMAIEQWGFCRVSQKVTVTRGIRLSWPPLRTRDTHTYCRAFCSGAVITRFNDFGVSRLEFEHPIFCMLGERSDQLRHRHGQWFRGKEWKYVELTCMQRQQRQRPHQ